MHNIYTFESMRPEETIDYHLQLSWLAVSKMYNQIASEFGMTRTMGYVLMMLDEKSGTSATQIVPMLGMEPTSLSRMLRNLEARGLVCRRQHEGDGRKVMICLTEEGKEKRRLARSVVRRFNSQLLSVLSEEEFIIFKEVIGKVHSAVGEFRSISVSST